MDVSHHFFLLFVPPPEAGNMSNDLQAVSGGDVFVEQFLTVQELHGQDRLQRHVHDGLRRQRHG